MELANNDGFLKSIKKAGKDFIIGAGNSLDKNIFLGTVFTVGGINQSSMPKSIPYKIGELAGDIGSFAFGAAEAGTGVGGELLGFTADGTVVLAPAGVALNAASLGLVTHGGATTIKSTHNFSEDLFSLIKGEGNRGAGNPVDYSRPSGFRKGVKDQVWENAKAEDDQVRDPLTNEIMDKDEPWDMGHKPGHEFRKHQERGITRKQFLDEHNNPDHYRPELPSSNRSHQGEDITDQYFGP